MKLLYGTSNPGKLEYMRECLKGLPIELIGLCDLSVPIPEVSEDGETPLENAKRKAQAYYKACGIPVFSCDSGLYFPELPEALSPKLHVRRVNGKQLNDEEMIAYYSGLAKQYGEITACYRNAICLVWNAQTVFCDDGDDLSGGAFLLAAVPHPKRVPGFPLDALSKRIATGAYVYDSPQEKKEQANLPGFRRFFRMVLQQIGEECE